MHNKRKSVHSAWQECTIQRISEIWSHFFLNHLVINTWDWSGFLSTMHTLLILIQSVCKHTHTHTQTHAFKCVLPMSLFTIKSVHSRGYSTKYFIYLKVKYHFFLCIMHAYGMKVCDYPVRKGINKVLNSANITKVINEALSFWAWITIMLHF